MKILRFGVLALSAITIMSAGSAQTLYGISNGFGTAADNRIYEINPTNGDLSNIVQVTMTGFTVTNALGLATDPTTNTMYAVLQTGSGSANRRLATIDPTTGAATDIGSIGIGISSITFRADGTLWAVSGDGATPPETLFTLNKTTGAATQQFALGNGADGEVIAFHPNDLMYHSSGNSTAVFEHVNVDTQVVTGIGTASGEAFAMGWWASGNQMLLSDIGSNLFSVDLGTGARTLIGAMSDQLGGSDNRGLATLNPIPEPATMAALGLAAAALIRRRRNSA